MKILFYFGGFAPVGGIEIFAKNLFLSMESTYDCTLLCWGELSNLLKSIVNSHVKVIRVPFRWGCRWNLPDWLLATQSFSPVKAADIIILGKLFPQPILKIIRFWAGESRSLIYVTPYKPHTPDESKEREKCLASLKLFDLICVQALSFADELRVIGYNGNIRVIPYITPDVDSLANWPQTQTIKIGFLGRLVPDKNISLLLHAFHALIHSKQFINEHPNSLAELHIYGDGHLRSELQNIADGLEISSQVIFHGKVSHEKVRAAIHNCHFFAFTSHVEGQCLAALEILSCGRPIIATPAGALPEILADSRLGELIDSSEVETVSDSLAKMVRLIKSKHFTPETIREAYLEKYNPYDILRRYEEAIQSLN